MARLINWSLGISIIILGTRIINEPKFFSRRFYYVDFSGYNIPFGIFMIIVGVLFIWTTLRQKKKNGKGDGV